MALGGGTFLTQNKVLPGAYMNFVSANTASASVSDRGVATIGVELPWGKTDSLFAVTPAKLQKESMKIFGYSYTDEHLKPVRDLMMYSKKVYFYRLNGAGEKAKNDLATAVYPGTRGNDIAVSISADVDEKDKWDVVTSINVTEDGKTTLVMLDKQIVSAASELQDNDYVTFATGIELAAKANTYLTGGTDSEVTSANHQTYLGLAEHVVFNAIGYAGTDEAVKKLYSTYTKRCRDDGGKKFQCVLFDYKADFEGVVSINPENTVADSGADAASAVYWTLGVVAGTAINASATNKKYDGEYTIHTPEQESLEDSIKNGYFTFHADQDENGNEGVYVLTDINTLTTLTDEKGEVFQDNQTIRIIDNIANDIALLFKTRYIGKVPDDAAGRTSFWSALVSYYKKLQDIRALQNFKESDIKVEQGEDKHAVQVTGTIEIVNTMTHLYMTTYVA